MLQSYQVTIPFLQIYGKIGSTSGTILKPCAVYMWAPGFCHISPCTFHLISHVYMAWKLDFSMQKVPPHKLGVFLYIIHLNRYHIQGYISGKLTKFIDWIFNYSEFSKMAAGSDLTQLHSGMTSFSNLKLQISSTFQLTH